MNRKALIAVLAATLFLAATAAHTHGNERHGQESKTNSQAVSTEEHDFGRQGVAAKATRTITIRMSDSMRFEPAEIEVKQGETVRFLVTNDGKVLHEMVIGTLDQLKEHGELMRRFPNMEHDEPYMAHVASGRAEEIVWTFTKPGRFSFGCLVPGHFEAGMVGTIVVSQR